MENITAAPSLSASFSFCWTTSNPTRWTVHSPINLHKVPHSCLIVYLISLHFNSFHLCFAHLQSWEPFYIKFLKLSKIIQALYFFYSECYIAPLYSLVGKPTLSLPLSYILTQLTFLLLLLFLLSWISSFFSQLVWNHSF